MIAALAFLVPLALWPAWEDTFDLPKLWLAAAAWLYLSLAAAWQRKPLTPACVQLAWPIAGAALSVLVPAFFSVDFSLSLTGVYRVYSFGVLALAITAGLAFSSAQHAGTGSDARVREAIQWGGAVVGLYAVMQFAGMEVLSAIPKVEGGRPWSSLGNPVYVGAVCSMALVLTLDQMARGGPSWRATLLAAQGAGLLLSQSRGAWLGTLLGALVVASALPPRAKGRTLAAQYGPLLLALVAIGGAALAVPAWRSRLFSMASVREGSNAARLEGWKAAVRLWKERPLLGGGPDTFVLTFRGQRREAYIRAAGPSMTQAHAHNDILQMASTQGALGVLAYLALLGWLWRALAPRPGARAAVFALIFQSQFNFSSITTHVWSALLVGTSLAASGIPGPTPERKAIPERRTPWRWTLVAPAMAALVTVWAMGSAAGQAQAAKQAMARGQAISAVARWRSAIAWAPWNTSFRSGLGNAIRDIVQNAPAGSLKSDLLNEALTHAQKATEWHPLDPDAWNNRGVTVMWAVQMDNRAELMPLAKSCFDRAVALDPYFVDALANSAKWQHLDGNLEGEKRLWNDVLRLDPTHEMARRVLQR